MNHKTIKRDGYTIHFTKLNKFKTSNIKICYSIPFEDKYYYLDLLTVLLSSSSAKYPKESDAATKCIDLYDPNYRFDNNIFSNRESLIVDFNTILDKYSTKDNLLDVIDFITELIYHPLVKSNKFNEETFLLAKRKAFNQIKEAEESVNYNARCNMYKLFTTEKAITSFDTLPLLDKINNQDLYTYYTDFIKKANVEIFVTGNLDINPIIKKFDEIITNKNNYYSFNFSHNNTDIKEESLVKIEDSKFSESLLYIGYKANDLTKEELYVASTILTTLLIDPSFGIIHDDLRNKRSLCYYVDGSHWYSIPTLIIRTGIDANNFDLAKDLIIKDIKKIQDGKLDDLLFNNIKHELKVSLDTRHDTLLAYANDYFIYQMNGIIQSTEYLNILSKITKEEVINYAKKLKLDTIYMYRGGNNAKN